ncbi:MAG: zinc ABC transporter substrate-binding protein [Gemmataceae bacterium]|nr:zinc ABC transporter substrate-binding protein [Gemmataceae bacterium]
MIRSTLFLCAVCSIFLIGCQSANGPSDGRIPVVCTTSLIADAVKRIGGDRVRVECLMGPGIDPHRYTATPGDIRKLSDARIVFQHGLHLEGKLGDVLEKPRPGQRSLVITRDLTESRLLPGDGGDGPHDPHVWFDPRLWADCLPPIVAALSETDPEGKNDFENAAKAYREEILAVDRELESLVQSLPAERRKLVTSHDAFRYFGARYGIEVHGLLGISTGSEASTRDVGQLAAFLATNKVPVIFGETSVPSKGLKAVIDSCEKKHGHSVRLIGGDDALYSDALGEPDSPGATYLGMIRHNTNIIVDALKSRP